MKETVLPNALKAIKELKHNAKLLQDWLKLDFIGGKTRRMMEIVNLLQSDSLGGEDALKELQQELEKMYIPE